MIDLPVQFPSSLRSKPSIDWQRDARDPPGLLAGQEDGGTGDVLWRTDGSPRVQAVHVIRGRQMFDDVGEDGRLDD